MKEKKLKEITPVEGMVSLFESMKNMAMGGEREWKKDNLNNAKDNWVVDTCMAFDVKVWETGISQDKEDSWTIVEQYADRKEAEIGHAKWTELIMADPNKELEDIQVWGV